MADTGITRIYQFLNNYDGDWKTDADKNKDGTLIKAEVYTFLADKFDWEDNDNERDIINKFWKSIDTNMTGKVKAGSGINNKNALDNNEVEQVEKMMKIADQISEFMNNKNCPTDKISNSTRWKNDVKDTLLEKVLDYMRNHPEQENITDEQLNNFYNLIERFETAKYYADELKTTLGNNLKDSDGKSLYKVNSDDKLTSIINNYIKKIESYDTSVTIDDILNEVEKIINAYKDTANTNSESSVNTLSEYRYDKDGKLNDLQKETLKYNITEKITDYLTKNEDMKDIYTDEYKSQIDTLIQNYITSYIDKKYASEFTSLNNGFKVEDFINSTEFKQLLADIEAGKTRAEENKKEEQKKEESLNYKSLADIMSKIKEENLHLMADGIAEIHTEFGMNSSGNIVFEQTETKTVYENMKKMLIDELQNLQPEAYNAISADIDRLIQAAWIMTYNDYASSSKWNTSSFLGKVLDNFESILNKLKTNPEFLSVFAADHTAYANSSLTSNLEYYGKKEDDGQDSVWVYEGSCSINNNGAITWDDTADAAEYNKEMAQLLKNIKNTKPYSSIDPNLITSVFRDAQQQAITACVANKQDCPYGTTTQVDLDIYHGGWLHMGSKHFDAKSHTMNATEGQDWAGVSREDDDSRISIRALVEMTLYYFDKLLYKKLAE